MKKNRGNIKKRADNKGNSYSWTGGSSKERRATNKTSGRNNEQNRSRKKSRRNEKNRSGKQK